MKKKLSCLIVDDVPKQLENLTTLVQKLADVEIVLTTTDVLGARDFLIQRPVDIVFSDVSMPVLSGLELAQLCKGQAHFILCTGHAEYAAESYEYEVADYVLKPVTLNRLIKAVDKIRQKYTTPQPVPSDELLFLKVDRDRFVKINKSDIVYIKSAHNHVIYYTLYTQELVRSTLQELEKELLPPAFIRTHKSYLVALDKIQEVEGNRIWLKGREGKRVELPLSDHYREAFMYILRHK